MRNTKVFFTCFFLAIFSVQSVFGQGEATRDIADSLSVFFDADAEALEDLISDNPWYGIVPPSSMQFSHNQVLRFTKKNDTIPDFLIISNQAICDTLLPEIRRYSEDIHTIYGYGVILESVTGASSEELKSIILSYQNNLCGVLFIGSVGDVFFEIEKDYNRDDAGYGYKTWPCDLFFMDLDGQWTDTDNNGKYDTHAGDVAPEIYFGRISTDGMPTLNQVTALRDFFNKDHSFWWNSSYQSEIKSIAYTDKDWTSIYFAYDFFSNHFKSLSGTSNTDNVRYGIEPEFSPNDYLTRLSSDTYRFIQLAAHSGPSVHDFTNGIISVNSILHTPSSSIGYNLYCCSACNWKLSSYYDGYLGGAYLFGGEKTLAVVGSTKTGSMLGFNYFYSSLINGKTIGESLKDWWINYCGNTHNILEISWHYGMTILGDPNINFRHNVCNYCTENLVLTSFPQGDNSNLVMRKAATSITLSNNYAIPQGVHVIADAPKITIQGRFVCPQGSSFETRNEGCNIVSIN